MLLCCLVYEYLILGSVPIFLKTLLYFNILWLCFCVFCVRGEGGGMGITVVKISARESVRPCGNAPPTVAPIQTNVAAVSDFGGMVEWFL